MLIYIENLYGSETKRVLEYMLNKHGEVTDEVISQETGLKINIVRRALYNLLEQGLLSYRRVRDRNSGWFIYYWSLNMDKLNTILLSRKKMLLDKLRKRLQFEENNEFYICPLDGARYVFSEAVENDFRCPRCGEMLTYEDNADAIRFLRRKISEIEEELRREERLLVG